MKRVITYGTFDMLHPGHIRLLKRAKSMGDYLVVALSSDEFNELKGKTAYYSYEDRKYVLESLRFVDEVIREDDWNQKHSDIVDHSIDLFVMGDDWEGKFDYLSTCCEVIYLSRTKGISTTQIKHDLKAEAR